MSGFQSVIFDFDGTLVDTWRLYIECYRRVLTEFFGEAKTAGQILEMRPRAEIRFFLDPPYADDFEPLYQAFINQYAAAHAEFCDGPYPGAFATVDAIHDRGLATGLVTGKSRAAYDISVRETGAPEFAISICDDDVNHPKPHTEGVVRACQLLDVEPERSIYVGDSEVDLLAAEQAGMHFAGVLYAKNQAEETEFRALCSDRQRVTLLNAPGDLLTLLDRGE